MRTDLKLYEHRQLELLSDRIHYVRSELRRENVTLRRRIEDLEDIVSRYLETPREIRKKEVEEERATWQRAMRVIEKQ